MTRKLAFLIVAVAALTCPASASAQTDTTAMVVQTDSTGIVVDTTAIAAPRLAATVLNPCTKQYVTISGTTTLSVAEEVNGHGALTFVLSAATNATGAAFGSTATKYSFTEIESVVARATAAQAMEVGFDSKLQARGSTAGDRWGLAVRIRLTVDEFGRITAASVTPGPSRCIG